MTSRMKFKPGSILITAIGGIAIATLLVACGDKKTTQRTVEAVPASSPVGGTGMQPVPTVGGTQVGQPIVPTPVPPTAQEVRQAWKDGTSLFDRKDYEGASTQLQIVTDNRPNDAYAHYLFGLALWKTGHLDEAESALTTSSTLDGQKPKCWINLARVRMQKDDFSGALQAADQALTLDPGSADALHQRGRALAGERRNDEALEALTQARTADPENGYIANTLGHFLLTAGRVDEAVPHLEAARDRLPEVAFVRNNLGVAYERQGDLDRAVEEYRAAVEAGDSDGKAGQSLARLEPIVGPEKIAGNPKTEDATVTDGEEVTDGGAIGDTAGDGTDGGSTDDSGASLDSSS